MRIIGARRLHPVVAAAVRGAASAQVLLRLADDPRFRWIAEAVQADEDEWPGGPSGVTR